MSDDRKILITGAQGLIGRALLKHYQSLAQPVHGVDLRGDGGDVHAGDIAAPEDWSDLLAASHTVIHTAALVSNALDDAEMWRVNVLATRQLIAAARRHGVRRFVHISSIVVYGNAASGELDESCPVHADGGSYVRTKIAAEHSVLSAYADGGIEVVILRPGDVYGPGCRVWIDVPLQLIRSHQFLLPASGKGHFRPTYIDDLVRGIACAAASPQACGQTFNLSCRGAISTREFFQHHHQWLRRPGPLCLPTLPALVLAQSNFQVRRLLGRRSEASPASIQQLTSQAWFDIRKAETMLGWVPAVSLAEGMQHSRAWAESQGLLD